MYEPPQTNFDGAIIALSFDIDLYNVKHHMYYSSSIVLFWTTHLRID